MKKWNYFYETMRDIFNACFEGSCPFDENRIKECLPFFEYVVRYVYCAADATSLYDSTSSVRSLKKELNISCNNTDTPYIRCLHDFLSQNLLCETSNVKRDNRYKKKSLNDLKEYCTIDLGLSQDFLCDLTEGQTVEAAQESLIDIIVLCFVIARHGFIMPPLHLHDVFPSFSDTKNSALQTSLSQNMSKFTVIYGSPYEREIQYMTSQVLNQLSGISQSVSFYHYPYFSFPKDANLLLSPKYTDKESQLYPGIWNAYLNDKNAHYFIIYNIPTQKDLKLLLSECKLIKHIVLLSNFDVDPNQDMPDVQYLSFHDVAVKPSISDIRSYLNLKKIDDPDNKLGDMIFSITKGQPHLVYSLEKCITSKKPSSSDLNRLKSDAAYQLTAPDKILTSSRQYNISAFRTKDREDSSSDCDEQNDNSDIWKLPYENTRNNLLGHIRRGYSKVLSVRERFIILLLALYGENGITEVLVNALFSKDQLAALSALVKEEFVSYNNGVYRYEGSVLLPTAFLYNDHLNKDEKEPLFSEVFSFLRSLQDELLYQNSVSLDYGLLRELIKKTFIILYRLLHKSSNDYTEHFKTIWFFHIICLQFLLDNRDIETIQEISDPLKKLGNEYMQRFPQYSDWKYLYKQYKSFIKLIVSAASDGIQAKDIDKLMDKLTEFFDVSITEENKAPFADAAFWKIFISLAEFMVSYGIRLNLIDFFNARLETNKDVQKLSLDKLMKSQQAVMLLQGFPPRITISLGSLLCRKTKVLLRQDKYLAAFYTKIESGDFSPLHFYFNSDPSSPRYEHLANFERNCLILLEKSYQNKNDPFYSDTDTVSLFNLVMQQYESLDTIPAAMLSSFYNARFYYSFARSRESALSELSDIRKDFERYMHIPGDETSLPVFDDLIHQVENSP